MKSKRSRTTFKLQPELTKLEEKQLMSIVGSSTQFQSDRIASLIAATQLEQQSSRAERLATWQSMITQQRQERLAELRSRFQTPPPFTVPPDVGLVTNPGERVATGIDLERITNPTDVNSLPVVPFKQVLVQGRTPRPGQTLNVIFVTLRNSTNETFDADDGFAVRLTNQTPDHAVPLLVGSEQWKPGDVMVLYFFTQEYYPLSKPQSAGFTFNFIDRDKVAIPGPSGLFQRLTFNPDTFFDVLNSIALFGPGAVGRGLGLPDTAIWEIKPSGFGIRRLGSDS